MLSMLVTEADMYKQERHQPHNKTEHGQYLGYTTYCTYSILNLNVMQWFSFHADLRVYVNPSSCLI